MRISREGVYPPERLERRGDLRGNLLRYIPYISKGMQSLYQWLLLTTVSAACLNHWICVGIPRNTQKGAGHK